MSYEHEHSSGLYATPCFPKSHLFLIAQMAPSCEVVKSEG